MMIILIILIITILLLLLLIIIRLIIISILTIILMIIISIIIHIVIVLVIILATCGRPPRPSPPAPWRRRRLPWPASSRAWSSTRAGLAVRDSCLPRETSRGGRCPRSNSFGACLRAREVHPFWSENQLRSNPRPVPFITSVLFNVHETGARNKQT